MRYDGILFDLDGTLWDATKQILHSWNQVLEEEPDIRRPLTLKEVEGVMGMAPLPLMQTLFPQFSDQRNLSLFEKCCQAENQYLRAHGGKLYPGIEDMLRRLSAQVPLAIVSNCNDGYIPSFLEFHGLADYFADFECAVTGLPKSGNIRLVVERNGWKAPVYVGDTELDRRSAEEAGVPFIHAAYGFGTAPGAVSIQSPSELPALAECP